MTDKIEDIRERHQIDAGWCGWWSDDRKQQHDDRGTLLAEVDRLREEVAALRSHHATLLAEVARLCTENERLRLALENIASGDYSDPHFPQWYAEDVLTWKYPR